MVMRFFAIAVMGLAAAGCAGEPKSPWGGAQNLGAGSLGVVAVASAATAAERPTPAQVSTIEPTGSVPPIKKTLAGKVLSAMALERATGRKPDPSRLNELD